MEADITGQGTNLSPILIGREIHEVQRAQARSHAIQRECMTSPRNTYRDPESRREQQ